MAATIATIAHCQLANNLAAFVVLILATTLAITLASAPYSHV
jgi:hypothetical protein